MRAALTTALIKCTFGEVAVLLRRALSSYLANGLHCWHAVAQWVQAGIFGGASIVHGSQERALAHLEHDAKFTARRSDQQVVGGFRGMC